MKEKVDAIKNAVKNCGIIHLGSNCGKYVYLSYDGESVNVTSFAGHYGYDVTDLNNLSARLIDTIYDDINDLI